MIKELSEIESLRRKLDKVDLRNVDSYGRNSINIYSFRDWCRIASDIDNPDKARNLLYYGFQPLYDLLIDNKISSKDRENAVNALNEIVDVSINFLSGYYIGEPNTLILRNRASKFSSFFEEFDTYEFHKKYRNIDNGQIYPKNILNFIKNFLDSNLDGKVSALDYYVGCACGTSEIVMALSGITETKLGFLRYSKRRGDKEVKIIKEQESYIKKNVSSKKVGVFEDFVCTKNSLTNVLNKIKEWEPNYLKGFSVEDSEEGGNIKRELNISNFKVFSLK